MTIRGSLSFLQGSRASRRSLLLCATMCSAQDLDAQSLARIVGCVRAANGSPMSSVRVAVTDLTASTVTKDNGCFSLELPPGEWTVRAQRIGYTPTQAGVQVPTRDTLRLTLVRASRTLPKSLVVGELDRSVVTSIQPAALRQLPALGERDVFRSLPFVPAVSQPNDIIGRVHLAGGASDEHGVTLDGHPLQAPFHVLQVFGAFNPASLDRMDVRMAQLPVSAFDRISGSVDLHSRGADTVPVRELQLSLVSTSAVIVQPSFLGVADVTIAGRSSYVDAIIRGLGIKDVNGGDDLRFPTYRDLVVSISRQRQQWGAHGTYFYTRDRLPPSGQTAAGRPTSGERMLGLTLWRSMGAWRTDSKLSLGVADVRQFQAIDNPNDPLPSTPVFIDIRQRRVSGSSSLSWTGSKWRHDVGVQYDARAHDNAWSLFNARERIATSAPLSADVSERQGLLSVFGESSRTLSRANMTLGLRASTVEGATHVMPRVNLAVPLTTTTLLSFGAERRVQFDAVAGEPIEGNVNPPTYLLSTPRRADVASVGATWRPTTKTGGSRMQATATLFARRNEAIPVLPWSVIGGVLEAAQRDRSIIDTLPPRFERVSGHVIGATLAIDVTTRSGWMLQGGYTRQRAEDRRTGRVQPVPWDAAHQLVALLGVPIGARWQFTLAQQYRSGAPVTPVALRLLQPIRYGAFYSDRFVPGDELSARAPSYNRTDIGVQRTWQTKRREWVLSAQVINALYRKNGLDVSVPGSLFCKQSSGEFCNENGARQLSLPIIPSIGLEVRW